MYWHNADTYAGIMPTYAGHDGAPLMYQAMPTYADKDPAAYAEKVAHIQEQLLF